MRMMGYFGNRQAERGFVSKFLSPPMKQRRWTSALFCLALALCAAAVPAEAMTYTIIDVPGAQDTLAIGINAHGIVVGRYGDSSHPHGFIRAADGSFTLFDPSSSTYTAPVGINAQGFVVGSYLDNADVSHGFIRDPDGNITTISSGINLTASAINAGGDVCGSFSSSLGSLHGFLRTADGTFTQFDPPGSIYTEADSINDSGAIVGFFEDGQYGEHGFLRGADGTITILDVPGAAWTIADTINATGSIAGAYSDIQEVHGFVRDPAGGFTSFAAGTLPRTLVKSANINDRGMIAGFDQTHKRRTHSYIRKPDGTIDNLHIPGQDGWAIPFGINREGAIVGAFEDSQNATDGFLRTP
jgi:hypothetical protein